MLLDSTSSIPWNTCVCVCVCVCVLAQSCPTLCYPMDCRPPGSSVHEILRARILEWVAISFYRGCSQTRGWNWVFCAAGRCFSTWVMYFHLEDFPQGMGTVLTMGTPKTGARNAQKTAPSLYPKCHAHYPKRWKRKFPQLQKKWGNLPMPVMAVIDWPDLGPSKASEKTVTIT